MRNPDVSQLRWNLVLYAYIILILSFILSCLLREVMTYVIGCIEKGKEAFVHDCILQD
jgi:hypothetical protein